MCAGGVHDVVYWQGKLNFAVTRAAAVVVWWVVGDAMPG